MTLLHWTLFGLVSLNLGFLIFIYFMQKKNHPIHNWVRKTTQRVLIRHHAKKVVRYLKHTPRGMGRSFSPSWMDRFVGNAGIAHLLKMLDLNPVYRNDADTFYRIMLEAKYCLSKTGSGKLSKIKYKSQLRVFEQLIDRMTDNGLRFFKIKHLEQDLGDDSVHYLNKAKKNNSQQASQ